MSDRPAETEYSALQALLHFRTNSSADGVSTGTGRPGENPIGTDPGSVTTNVAQGAAINHNADIVNLIRMSANPASFLQQSHMNFSPSQLAALTAATTATMQNSAAAAAAAHHIGGVYQVAGLQSPSYSTANILHSPFQASSPLAPAPVPLAIEMPGSPALSPLHPAPQPFSPHGGILEGGEPPEKKIRKDEVEAALRSKPQRGRKRDNLNAEERLELTRTRNREHAKSTRIRKKARYQELLDTEQKYLELQTSQQWESKRREAVFGFLEARAIMLSRMVKNITASSTEEDRKSSENRSVSFDHSDSFLKESDVDQHGTARNSNLKDDEGIKKVTDYMADESSFIFESSMCDVSCKDASSMTRFDESVARRLQQMFGNDAASLELHYKVLGSSSGIAFNQDGSAFARVDLTCGETIWEEAQVVLSSLVSMEFSNDSNLIQSVAWSILKDATAKSGVESASESKSDSTAKDSLESQTVYPSVVSFDEAQREKAKDRLLDANHTEHHDEGDDHMEDPGMSI